jgi:hypothetical protein
MESEMNTQTMQSAMQSAMKSAIEWSPGQARASRTVPDSTVRLGGALRLATRLLLALAPALAIMVGAAWLVTLPGAALFLQATLGAGGFVFLALAVESETPQAALLQLATGFALPVLAWLSSREAVEIAIVAAALVAVWVTAAVWQSTAPR